jgi:hypothetical protein
VAFLIRVVCEVMAYSLTLSVAGVITGASRQKECIMTTVSISYLSGTPVRKLLQHFTCRRHGVWNHAVQRNGKWESRTEAKAFGSCRRMGVESAQYAIVVASNCSIRER